MSPRDDNSIGVDFQYRLTRSPSLSSSLCLSLSLSLAVPSLVSGITIINRLAPEWRSLIVECRRESHPVALVVVVVHRCRRRRRRHDDDGTLYGESSGNARARLVARFVITSDRKGKRTVSLHNFRISSCTAVLLLLRPRPHVTAYKPHLSLSLPPSSFSRTLRKRGNQVSAKRERERGRKRRRRRNERRLQRRLNQISSRGTKRKRVRERDGWIDRSSSNRTTYGPVGREFRLADQEGERERELV